MNFTINLPFNQIFKSFSVNFTAFKRRNQRCVISPKIQSLFHSRLHSSTSSILSFLCVFTILCLSVASPLKAATLQKSKSTNTDEYTHFFNLIQHKQWHAAQEYLQNHPDPVSTLFMNWAKYQDPKSVSSFADLKAFLETYKGWPHQSRILENAEIALIRERRSIEALSWFDLHPPRSFDATLFYLKAVEDHRDTRDLTQKVREIWTTSKLTGENQKHFYKDYHHYLSDDHHQKRMNLLISSQNYTLAERLTDLMKDHDHKNLAHLKLALAKESPRIDHLLNKVPDEMRHEAYTNQLLVKWYRHKKDDIAALKLLLNKNLDFPKTTEMWKDRNYYARKLIQEQQYERAYRVIKDHGLGPGSEFVDAEFLTGWISLKFLKAPHAAAEHFSHLWEKALTPIAKARAAFWLARAHEALENPTEASHWYHQAKDYPTAFYGQLACQKVPCKLSDYLKKEISLDDQKHQAFLQEPRVILAKKFAKTNPNYSVMFLNSLADSLKDGTDIYLIAKLAHDLNLVDVSTRISRKAMYAHQSILEFAYPMLDEGVKGDHHQHALVHSIIRQESNFKKNAKSSAGALGLMQIMPNTAKYLAKKQQIRYSPEKLVTDPSYNIKLGSGYINQLVDQYQGSRALALAAYNAGPQNVNKWIAQYGNPQTGEIDELDWIELIPFNETRNYVQRVLENIQVYYLKLDQMPHATVFLNEDAETTPHL